MSYLGVIGGSNFLKSGYFASESFVIQVEETEHGLVKLYVNETDNVIFVQRHAANPDVDYTPPHLINKKAIIKALQQRNVARILAFNSTGSMKRTLSIGTIVIPDDFICLTPITFFDDYRAHLIPGFNAGLRTEIIEELRTNGFNPVSEATYVQTNGPRFETKSEIAVFAPHSDIVGMTSAHEATLAQELDIPYASVCMIDNYANGIGTPLTTDEFHKGVQQNLKVVEKVLALLLAKFSTPSSKDELSTPRQHISQLIHARWVIPVDPNSIDNVLDNHSIAVGEDGTILEILPIAEAKAKYVATTVTDVSKSHAVHPGLINAHSHLGMTLLRGYSDDKNLSDWLNYDIWPLEGRLANSGHRFVYTSALLGMAEMVRGGTTCFNDMYMVPSQTAEAAIEMGLRGIIAFPVMSQPWLPDFECQAKEGVEVREALAGNPLLSITCGPHAPYTVNDDTFLKIRQWNRENVESSGHADGSIVHLHLHETEAEVVDSIAGTGSACHLSDQRTSPVMNLARLGLLDKKTVAIHMTTLTDEEIAILAEKKVNVIHCPCSNLKLASGFCPVAKLLDAGVNVGLGTDSTASNNGLDMYAEMKTAAILAKAVSKTPTVVSAAVALKMATYNNAVALGLDDRVGSLEVGKQADIVAVHMGSIENIPIYNAITQLVYTGSSRNVSDVWVAGKRLLRNKALVHADKAKIYSEVEKFTKLIVDVRAEIEEEKAKKSAEQTPTQTEVEEKLA